MKRQTKIIFRNIGFIAVVLAFLAGIVHFESQSSDANITDLYDVLWYALVTLTTVGYGDYYPVTPIGKMMGVAIVLSSLGVLSYIISRISLKISSYMEDKKSGRFGTKFTNHFVIIGWDSFSKQVANQIIKSGYKIAVVTDNKNEVELIRELYTRDQVFVLFADHGNYEALEKVNIKDCSKLFMNFADDSKSLIHIININKLYKDIVVVVILNSQDLKETFQSIGVTYIVSKNEIASKLVASYIYEPDVAYLTEDLMEISTNEMDYDILQYKITEDNPYLNQQYLKTFSEMKEKYNAVLLGLSKANQSYKLLKNPNSDCRIEKDDYLI
ncbi:MAG: potassium channel protein, partial [Crocinitomicaceae bacterium]|nr:potassium channel protein [Crocinitomicaceae bacterium]